MSDTWRGRRFLPCKQVVSSERARRIYSGCVGTFCFSENQKLKSEHARMYGKRTRAACDCVYVVCVCDCALQKDSKKIEAPKLAIFRSSVSLWHQTLIWRFVPKDKANSSGATRKGTRDRQSCCSRSTHTAQATTLFLFLLSFHPQKYNKLRALAGLLSFPNLPRPPQVPDVNDDDALCRVDCCCCTPPLVLRCMHSRGTFSGRHLPTPPVAPTALLLLLLPTHS